MDVWVSVGPDTVVVGPRIVEVLAGRIVVWIRVEIKVEAGN